MKLVSEEELLRKFKVLLEVAQDAKKGEVFRENFLEVDYCHIDAIFYSDYLFGATLDISQIFTL